MNLRPVGANQTELSVNGITILFSYTTPVAVLGLGGNYKTDVWYSKTTSGHINKFFQGLEKPKEIPQSIIDNYLVEMEKGTSEYLFENAMSDQIDKTLDALDELTNIRI